MEYSHRYLASPNKEIAERLEHHIDVHRQAYNFARHEYTNLPDDTRPTSAYSHHDRLTEWKQQFPIFKEAHSKALQRTVTRFYRNLSNLSKKKDNGHRVGMLKWKPPREYRSMTYSQSGFKLNNTSGRTATLWLSKIGEFPIRYHRPIPDDTTIKEVTVKMETTGKWFVSFALETDTDYPEKPTVETLDTTNSVGLDLGITNYLYTSDGTSVGWLELEDDYERLRKAQRSLSLKQKGSRSYDKQQLVVAKRKRAIRRKVLDFQHKLSTWLVREYDAVFVEDLDVKLMLEAPQNARNKQTAAWRQFIDLLEYKGNLYGTHVVQVDARGTTKECSQCGVETAKPLWVREHLCPACGLSADRDANAAMNVLQRGFSAIGVGCSESTPVETALSTDTHSVSAKRVVESGSPVLNERVSASRAG